jgi:hypothetical protein
MELVLVSALLLATVLVWATVKVLQLATVWKTVEALEKVQDLQMDLELERVLQEWEKE